MAVDIFESVLRNSHLLVEALSPTQIKQLRSELAVGEILPCTFDVTVPGWLERIRHWGNVRIFHKDPERRLLKRRINTQSFVNRLSDPGLNRILGRWSVEKKGLNKVEFHRDYIGGNGKHYTEKFYVDVELRKELR